MSPSRRVALGDPVRELVGDGRDGDHEGEVEQQLELARDCGAARRSVEPPFGYASGRDRVRSAAEQR